MEGFFFLLILVVSGIVYLINKAVEADQEEAIRRAWKQGNYAEYNRLTRQQALRRRNAQASAEQNQRYMAAFFVLDAAEHGVFVPGAEQVFEDVDEEPDWYNGDDGFQEDDDGWQDDDYGGYDDDR